MQRVIYTDEKGLNWAILAPDGQAVEPYINNARQGPVIDVFTLGLPKAVAIRLHNELVARELFTSKQVKQRPGDVNAAVTAAYRVDAVKVINAYLLVEEQHGA